jgi:hypothetical protein
MTQILVLLVWTGNQLNGGIYTVLANTDFDAGDTAHLTNWVGGVTHMPSMNNIINRSITMELTSLKFPG